MQYDSQLKNVANAYRKLNITGEPTVLVGQMSVSTADVAIVQGWIEMFKYGTLEDIVPLVEKYPSIIGWKDSDGWTPLHFACWTNDDPDAIYWLAQRCDVNARTSQAQLPTDLLRLNKWFNVIPDTYGENIRMQRLIQIDTTKIIVDALINPT